MRLVLPFPESWPRRELDDDRTLVTVEGTPATLTVHHPRVVPMSLLEYASEIARSDLPEGAAAQVVAARVDENRIGWTVQLAEVRVTCRAGAELEARLTAVYRFNPYRTFVAAAVARMPPDRLEELRPRLAALYDEGRPDWTGPDVASLSQLYD
jgi:hypothetical protein